MKSVFIIILAVACFMKVNAQTSSENDAAGSTQNTTTLTLNLNNVVTMQEAYSSYSATFHTAGNYVNGEQLNGDGQPNGSLWGVNTFNVQSNRYYNVSFQSQPAVSYTPLAGATNSGLDNTNMPVSVFSFQLLNYSGTGGTPAAGVGSGHWTAFTGTPEAVLNNCTNGSTRSFGLAFLAEPYWNYAGGIYSTTATITATQE